MEKANRITRKCFICYSEDHTVKWNCPSRRHSRYHITRSDTPKKAETHQAKHVASASGGLYEESKNSNIITELLIDTGATLSILSLKAWDMIIQSGSSKLKKFSMQVFTASASQIEVKGKTTVIIELCGAQCITVIVVAGIDMGAILELDFLKAYSCLFDVENTRVLPNVLSLGSDYFSATFYPIYFYYNPSKYSPFTETHFCNLFTQSRKADKLSFFFFFFFFFFFCICWRH